MKTVTGNRKKTIDRKNRVVGNRHLWQLMVGSVHTTFITRSIYSPDIPVWIGIRLFVHIFSDGGGTGRFMDLRCVKFILFTLW